MLTFKKMTSETRTTEDSKAEIENNERKNPTDIMLQRWVNHQQNIPKVDKNDIQNHNPLICG